MKRSVAALLGATVWIACLAASAPADIATRARLAFGSSAGAIAISLPFAVVNFHNLAFEEPNATGQALFRRYHFGLQMLDLQMGRLRSCDLRALGVPASAVANLSANGFGLPTPTPGGAGACRGPRPPFMPSADEEAVRAVIPGTPLQWFRDVYIVDGYAVISWAGGGGGPMIAQKRAGAWRVYHGTGGAPDACWLVRFGNVPPEIAHRLMVAWVGSDAPGVSRPTRVDACPAYH